MSRAGTVVHLAWGPLGTEPIDRFCASYRRFEAGEPHRLLVVFNGYQDDSELRVARGRFGATEHEALVLERPCLDIAAYRKVVETTDSPWFLFLNSYSELLDDDWLSKPLRHLSRPDVGIVGATGSFEGTATSPVRRLLRRGSLVPFPNPHIRTNAFMLQAPLAGDLDWGRGRSKADAWQTENGHGSLTRQIAARGLSVMVVGRDGEGYEPPRWPDARVFRTPGQPNLLVSDNRTRDYEDAAPARRRELERLAWGGGGDPLRSTIV